ncbi:hypothetical protein FQN49_001059 [Arthroderma sp. PD_2]|nr:hypothetical protein FQN49_001059 [Arthroderma sp. PD_2]
MEISLGRRSPLSDSGFSVPSSPGGSQTSTCTASSSGAPDTLLNAERGQHHDDMTEFIPVGVIWLRAPASNSMSEVDSIPNYYPEVDALELLENAGWVQITVGYETSEGWIDARIYVMPEEKLRKLRRLPSTLKSLQRLRRALKEVMSKLDTSVEAWDGRFEHGRVRGAGEANLEGETLFYIFNTLESPKPESLSVSNPWALTAMSDLMYSGDEDDGNSALPGLRTKLYPYQRRSAAFMIQKEAEPSQSLDPRLQALRGPTGRKYYFDKEDGTVFDEPKMYSNACGGILAETMGYGKTLICLAVILATRGHVPSIPSEYVSTDRPVRAKTASLMEMSAAAAGARSIPWALHFRRLQSHGMHYSKCIAACEENRGSYTINRAPRYARRCTNSKDTSPRIYLSSGSLVIVPPNLVDHWLAEIEKHTEELKVLVLRDIKDETPPVIELLKYDIVLFSLPRFQREYGEVSATSPVTYNSPLRRIHWLRIMVDEGHSFATSTGGKTSSVHMLEKLHVERRWIVSGTPSKGLYGIEVSLAAESTVGPYPEGDKGTFGPYPEGDKASGILQARRSSENVLNEELKKLKNLQGMIVHFLKLKPWSNSHAADPANWTKYMTPTGPDGKRRMSPSLRSTLQSLVVRHRSEDLHRELPLPKLYNEVVYLEPTFYDKASLNLFILRIVVNAITSERSDEDYLFHPKNKKHLSHLLNNLRLAGFWWPTLETEMIQGTTLKAAKQYLEKNMFQMNDKDLILLRKAIVTGEKVLACASRNTMCQQEEMGIFVENFPGHAQRFWAIDESAEQQEPLLLGLSLAREAQKFVTTHLCSLDPGEGLAGAGLRARLKHKKVKPTGQTTTDPETDGNGNLIHRSKPEKPNNGKTTSRSKSLPSESPLKKTKVVATVSAKLTYLLEKVLEFQESEKIIIFYESENTAFWIAEGLEMLGTDFRIYASTLKPSQKSEYLSVFNESESVRVLLMDLRQAAHGLHIACASRVFIVNPIWDPNIESQAIKRAHRISQTRTVYVETLVLKDTLEDKMLKRRKQMSSTEMQHAEKDMLDDHTMSHIIQNEEFLPLPDDLRSPTPAFFKNPPGFFDRHTLPVPEEYIDPVQPATARVPVLNPLAPDSPTSDNKRRLANFFESNLPITPPGRRSPKRRRESPTQEHVDENGIIFISPRSRTPRRRRPSSNLSDGPSTSS